MQLLKYMIFTLLLIVSIYAHATNCGAGAGNQEFWEWDQTEDISGSDDLEGKKRNKGKRAYRGKKSGSLRVRMNGSKGLRSYKFVIKVGGIAFEAIAKPAQPLKGELVLNYDPNQPDGQRLSIAIAEKTYRPFLPDWLLVPIARYSDSEDTSVVSLFGPEKNKDCYDLVYHPAFEDTLLGVRLLQADMLLTNLDRYQVLPKYSGKLLIGVGEPKVQIIPSKKLAKIFLLFTMLGNEIQSWVITDYNVDIKFSVEGNNLKLSGFPYHYFWKQDQIQIKAIRKKAENCKKMKEDGQIFEALVCKVELDQQIEKMTVIELTKPIQQMKKQKNLLRAINPSVFDATLETMRWSAFFRYIKRNDLAGWKKFLKQLESVKITPVVKTPTKMERN